MQKKKSSFCVVLMNLPNLLYEALLNTVHCFVYLLEDEKLERIRFSLVYIDRFK